MVKPSKTAYENACRDMDMHLKWINYSKSKIDEYLDKIVAEKNALKLYEEEYQKLEQVKDIYEAYEEVEKSNAISNNRKNS